MQNKNEKTKFKIVRKGYDAKEVDLFLAKAEKDNAALAAESKKTIDELSAKNAELSAKLDEYEKKTKKISEAIMSAVAKADEIEKLAAFKYTQEMEQLKAFHNRWLSYYAKLIKKYPLTEDLEAVSAFNDKVNRILGEADEDDASATKFRAEFSKLIKQNGELDDESDDDIPSFSKATFMKLPEEGKSLPESDERKGVQPAKSGYKSVDHATGKADLSVPSESGFDFDEALHPTQSLEEIMQDLGLLMGDDDNKNA